MRPSREHTDVHLSVDDNDDKGRSHPNEKSQNWSTYSKTKWMFLKIIILLRNINNIM